MPENRKRFVLMCQQVLAFGTVAALAVPAAGVVTLDIVKPVRPDDVAAPSSGAADESRVASQPVKPQVTEIPVNGVSPAGVKALEAPVSSLESDGPGALRLASSDQPDNEKLAALSRPEPVSGYAVVGVTWKHGVEVDESDITVSVRSLQNGGWSEWAVVEYHDEHAPDPGSEEARNARPGTEPVVVGDVDKVQVKAETTTGEAPAGMRLATIDPGETSDQVVEQPAIDTAGLGSQAGAALSAAQVRAGVDPNVPDPNAPDPAATVATEEGVLTGTPAKVTAKPKIYSRAQWGANENMRDKSSLHYFEVHAGFVHHTVNANKYTRDQVPSVIRGIYAYHTQSKGWSDIGYNFLVDRFGRIWEGRYGGVGRPVVGAHTLGYNDYAFALSAIGNYDIESGRPSAAMVDAYGRLFAWKLSLHGVRASSTKQRVGSRYFKAVNGHRDAGQTACPGRYLYAKIPTIRALADKYQKPFAGRAKSTNISGQAWPDLVVRRKADKHAYLIRTAGQVGFGSRARADKGWKSKNLLTAAHDVTGDGIGDMVGRAPSTGATAVYPGTAKGTFGSPIKSTQKFATKDMLAGVLDMNGDKKNDLVARDRTTHRLYLYYGNNRGAFFKGRLLASDWRGYSLTRGVGDMSGDGKADLAVRDANDRLWLVPGTTRGRLKAPVALPYTWGSYDLVSGTGDVTNDGEPDIIARKRKSKLTYIYPGNGHGGIGHRYGPFAGMKDVNFLASAGQLKGNHRSDMVGRVDNRLVVFTNNGNRNVGSVVDTGTVFSRANLVLNVGDWNGDGNGDVMTRSSKTGRLYLYAGNGRSRFAAPVTAGTRWNSRRLVAAVGDVTGDGFPDLMAQPRGGAMRIYPGNGKSGFRSSYVAHSAISANDQMGASLWSSDGTPDSITRRSDGSLMLYPGNGPGGLMDPHKVGSRANRYDWIQGVGDATGDGHPDLVARQRTTGDLWLLPGRRSGFAPRRFIAAGYEGYELG